MINGAYFFGLVCMLIGLLMLMRPHMFQKAILELQESKGLRFIAAYMAILIGALFATLDPESGLQATTQSFKIAKILGWLTILKGLMFLLFPAPLFQAWKWLYQTIPYKLWGILLMLIGIVLFALM